MNNKNQIVNLGYQLAIMIITFIFIIKYKIENNNGNNYSKIIGLIL